MLADEGWLDWGGGLLQREQGRGGAMLGREWSCACNSRRILLVVRYRHRWARLCRGGRGCLFLSVSIVVYRPTATLSTAAAKL